MPGHVTVVYAGGFELVDTIFLCEASCIFFFFFDARIRFVLIFAVYGLNTGQSRIISDDVLILIKIIDFR